MTTQDMQNSYKETEQQKTRDKTTTKSHITTTECQKKAENDP